MSIQSAIKNKLEWFKMMPLRYAVGILLLTTARKISGVMPKFSFSQAGEDILIEYLGLPIKGFYVDVGCNEPIQHSNTFKLYLQGWRGINIDANTDLIAKQKQTRKMDTAIRAAISNEVREVTFHKSPSSHAVSTIDEERLVDWKAQWEFPDELSEKVTTQTLTSILDKNLPENTQIDLLSVDVEGHDFQVIQGLDLSKYRPKVIIVEVWSFEMMQTSEIYKYLTEQNYSLKYYAVMNGYFVDNNAVQNNIKKFVDINLYKS